MRSIKDLKCQQRSRTRRKFFTTPQEREARDFINKIYTNQPFTLEAAYLDFAHIKLRNK